jgi:hypothetical protein
MNRETFPAPLRAAVESKHAILVVVGVIAGIERVGLGAAEFGSGRAPVVDTAAFFRQSGRFWVEPGHFLSRGYAGAVCSGERSNKEESPEYGAAALRSRGCG